METQKEAEISESLESMSLNLPEQDEAARQRKGHSRSAVEGEEGAVGGIPSRRLSDSALHTKTEIRGKGLHFEGSSQVGVGAGSLGQHKTDSSEVTPRKGASSKQRSMPMGRSSPLKSIKTATPGMIRPSGVLSVAGAQKPPGSSSERIVRHGQDGKKMPLNANYLHLKIEPGKGVYQYSLIFYPQIDNVQAVHKVLEQDAVVKVIGSVKTCDGSTLYLPRKLPQKTTSVTCKNPLRHNQEVQMKVAFSCERRLSECVHLYNVLLKRIESVLELVRIGRDSYNPKDGRIIPQYRLEIWPGFVTSVDEFEDGLMLVCDTSSRVLRTQTVHETIYSIYKVAGRENWKEEIMKVLLGTCVITRYNNRTYRVDDIAWNESPLSKFKNSSGRTLTYREYYLEQYGLEIKNLEPPLLLSRIKEKRRLEFGKSEEETTRLVCLVPELCNVTGISDEMREDYKLMKEVAMFTRVTPNQRLHSIKKFTEQVNCDPKCRKILADWGLTLSKDLVEVRGRILPEENVFLGNRNSVTGGSNAEWASQLLHNHVYKAVPLKNWMLLYTRRDSRFAQDFTEYYNRSAPQLGIAISTPLHVRLESNRTDLLLAEMRGNFSSKVQIIVIIVPCRREDRYAAIKKLCTVELGVPCQVITTTSLTRKDRIRPIVQNIALQINCKVGGSSWAVSIPYRNAMVVGIDTFHDSEKKTHSVVALVASINAEMTQFYSCIVKQGPGQEMSDSLKVSLMNGMTKYFNNTGSFPDRIIVYRDGVGDGQLSHLLGHEVRQIVEVLESGTEKHPKFCKAKLTYVVVQKRISTRLFQQGPRNVSNPPHGTVVDNAIVRPSLYDFFLISQKISQGTVNPTHYVVLYDNSDMSPDQVQRFTYKMTHLYYNWAGTIRVPSVVKYAHKLAELIGKCVRASPSPRLSTLFYYL